MSKTTYIFLSLTVVFLGFNACNNGQQKKVNTKTKSLTTVHQVEATVETDPVRSELGDDAADDPAIWINHQDPSQSRIIGTNKKAGLNVYDLAGKELYFYPVGRVNNVDVRQQVAMGDTTMDVVVASNRTNNSLAVFTVKHPTGELIEATETPLISSVGEVYGICLYHDKQSGKLFSFINGKDGMVEQWELSASPDQKISGSVVRTFNLASQPEGMVADDETGILYIGEEEQCAWKYDAKPDGNNTGKRIPLSDKSNSMIAFDIEGVTLYKGHSGKGYLLVSSQGNNSYAVFEREGNNKYIGSFAIKDGAIDGTQETDGIDVTNLNLGTQFPNGFFIVQDGDNKDGDTKVTQNFKLVAWEKIANSFDPPLLIDN